MSLHDVLIDTTLRKLFMPEPPPGPGIGGLTGITPPAGSQVVIALPGGERILGDRKGRNVGDKYGAGYVVDYAAQDSATGQWVDPQTVAEEDRPFQIPTMSELDRQGREAIQGQFDAETEQFESGKAILTKQEEDVDAMRLQKEEQLEAAADERTTQIQEFEDGMRELKDLPDDVRAEAYGNVESLKKSVDKRVDDALSEMTATYEGMRDILESMNAEHFAEARDRTAAMLQATGNAVMSEIGNTVTAMQVDPRFQEMSADQQSVALHTVRLQGSSKIGATLATVGAEERARLDQERVTRDTLLASFDQAFQAERGATVRALEGEAISQVGLAQREAGQMVTDAQVASAELLADVRRDMGNFRLESRAAEQAFISAQDTLILQGNRDAFTMNTALQRPVLASGMMNHMAAMLELGVGLLQLDYNNRLNQYAIETGYVGSMLAPFEGAMAYRAQEKIAKAGRPDDSFDWGGLIPNVGVNFAVGGGGSGGGGGGGDE